MEAKIVKNKKSLTIILVVFIIFINIFLVTLLYTKKSTIIKEKTITLSLNQEYSDDEWIREPHEDEQWIRNSEFEDSEGWSKQEEGDIRDISADISDGEAKYIISGDSYSYSPLLGAIKNESLPYNWINGTHPDVPSYPTVDFKFIENQGFFASHNWTDYHLVPDGWKIDGHQRASVQWERTIKTAHDMSNYNITSASLDILVNATVTATPRRANEVGVGGEAGIEIYGDEGTGAPVNGILTGDYIIFYALLSDINKERVFTVAKYKPLGLGNDSAGISDYLNDTTFSPEFNKDLIFYLNQVLEPNPNFFIITLGVEFFCEDNAPDGAESDFFNSTYIKACNFSFSYEKLINRETSASWIYEGDQINDKGGRVEIIDSKLYFDYKINTKVLRSITPNSEIRIFINNKKHSEAVKILKAETSFEEAEEDGFDITDLIPHDDEIKLELQFYIGDDFTLREGQKYVISVDDVILEISYIIYLSAEQSLLFLVLLIISIVILSCLTIYIVYYQKVLKYPKPIRKLRKYRKSLNNSKAPNIEIISREGAFHSLYNIKTKNLDYLFKSRHFKDLKSKDLSKIKSKLKITKKKYTIILLILVLSLQFIIPVILYRNMNNISIKTGNDMILLQNFDVQQWARESHEKQWVKNSEFDDSEDWYMGLSGEFGDLNAEISNGQANYKIVGNRSEIIWNVTNPSIDGWSLIENEFNILAPESAEIKENGWRVYHEWSEDPDQFVIAQWQKNYSLNSLGIDLNDYSITSASLEIWINGTVNQNIDRPGDSGLSDIALGDLAEYFILISDFKRERTFKVASYQDTNLGNDTGPVTILDDRKLTPITEDSLIYYLNRILKNNDFNFSLILGIQVWCEDNGSPGDSDIFQDLYFKNLSLALTFDKNIGKTSSVSWNYKGKKIESENKKIEIKDGNLKFDYKINKAWESIISPNSEIKIYINNEEHLETVKLTEAKTFFDEVKEDGFDVTELIPDDDEIELEIQVYIADDLILDDEFIISIDNVELEISYDLITITEQIILLPFIIGVLIAISGFISYFIYYQKVLRYPKPVRKVRKYRKKLKKKKDPEVSITSREKAFKIKYEEKIDVISSLLKSKKIKK